METSINPAENPKDVKMIHAAIKRWPKRWRGLSDDFKDTIVEGLAAAQAACRIALASADNPDAAVKASSAIANIARTAVMIEGQTQVDDWNQDKNDRLDSGKATEITGITIRVPGLPNGS